MTRHGYQFLMLAVSFAAAGCGDEAAPAPPPRPVKYATIQSASSDEARSYFASVQPRDATELSFRVGGNLAAVRVKMGGSIKTGELIARLDQADFQVALAQARASYQSARTARDTAQSAFKRVERLFEAGSSSQSDYETAKGQVTSAQAQLAAASQQVKQAKNQLSYTELRASFDGVVNSVPVKVGEQVGAGKTVAVVSKGGELEVSVGVPEGIVARIKVGTPAVVTLSALSEGPLRGAVREVGFVSQNSTYPVRITLESIPTTVRPGMAAEATFELGARKAGLVVPVSAVGNTEDGPFVFVIEKASAAHHVARRKTIEVGELVEDYFAVKDGLQAGDKVATAGLASLVDGMEVRLLEPRANGTSERRTGEALP